MHNEHFTVVAGQGGPSLNCFVHGSRLSSGSQPRGQGPQRHKSEGCKMINRVEKKKNLVGSKNLPLIFALLWNIG